MNESIHKKVTLLQLLDPLKTNMKYVSMELEDLEKELDVYTKKERKITHDDYLKIYELNVVDRNISDELNFLAYKLATKEKELQKKNMELNKREDKLLKLELMNKKKSKAPEVNDDMSHHSKSVVYEAYTYTTPEEYLDSNGQFSEDLAIKKAIEDSERLVREKLDSQFSIVSEESEDKDLPRYRHLSNRPTDVTDALLDELYDLLVNRKITEVKYILSSNRLTASSVRWLRNLSYEGETLKQMLSSSPEYIHRCIIPY